MQAMFQMPFSGRIIRNSHSWSSAVIFHFHRKSRNLTASTYAGIRELLYVTNNAIDRCFQEGPLIDILTSYEGPQSQELIQ